MNKVIDWLIIGAAKSGTTYLLFLLDKTKNCCGPTYPEDQIHFFSGKWEKGLGWYKNQLPNCKHVGEKTPGYLLHPKAPERVHSINPDVKLIVTLRNPVDRAYSHWLMLKRVGETDKSFSERIKEEFELYANEKGELDLKKDFVDILSPDLGRVPPFTVLLRGYYAFQLRNWFEYFPREQFLIFKQEELENNLTEHYEKLCDFLNVEPTADSAFQKGKHTYSSLEGKMREKLEKFYEPANRDLENLLQRKFW